MNDILFEMSNLHPKETGLSFAVFVSPRGGSRHSARIKATLPPWGLKPEAIYSITPFQLVEGEDWLSRSQVAALSLWIEKNREILVDFWEGRILYDFEVREKLLPI